MNENDEWTFPIDKFKVNNGYFCILREEDARSSEFLPDEIGAAHLSTGIRLECASITIPRGIGGYDEDTSESPEVVINLMLPFNDLNDLAIGIVEYGEEEQGGEFEQGSMYLFGVYNDIKCSEIRFGDTSGEKIEAEIDLTIKLNPDTGGAIFQHTLECELELEKQW